MNPTWRTSTVIALCEGMRQAQDYGACPILADALQDADYPDEEVLTRLRDPSLSPVLAEMTVAKLYSNETAEAVAHIEAFAARVGYTYEKVIGGVRGFVKFGEQYAGDAGYDFNDSDYDAAWAAQSATEDWRDGSPEAEAAKATRAALFDAFERVTATRVDESRRSESPFTCPC